MATIKQVSNFYYDSVLLTGSADRLRQAVGGFYNPIAVEDTDDSTAMYFNAPGSTDTDPFGEIPESYVGGDSVTTMGVGIKRVLVGTHAATLSSSTSMFPYYTMPVSIQGEIDEDDLLSADERWKQYIVGGVFNTITYPGIFSNVVFDVSSFAIDEPYNLLYVKTINPDNERINI